MLADAERLGRALVSRHAPGTRIAVYANNSPEWVLLEYGAALSAALPNAELIVFEHSEHLVARGEPEKYRAAMERFLAAHHPA